MGWNITDSKRLEDVVLKLRAELARKIGVKQGMTVVEMGCGQGGFTVCLARIIGHQRKLLSVDISEEYLAEFMENLKKWKVQDRVKFVHADAADLRKIILDDFADMVVSYRFLEELKQPDNMPKIIKEMARIAKKHGNVCIIELSTEARNKAEENYVRLHKESGDSFFEPPKIITAMKETGLKDVSMEKFETHIWFSSDVAKQELSLAQVWFDAVVKRTLGSQIERHGMKYPSFLIFSGVK